MKQKIFVIGPNKCATGSLHQFFKSNGLKSVHWDDGKLAKRMVSNISANMAPITGYEEYDCFSDFYYLDKELFISPLLIRSKLIEAFPEALFILNVRDYNSWKDSRIKHDNGSFGHRFNACLGQDYDSFSEYEAYNESLGAGIKYLHVFDLNDGDKFKRLSAFLCDNGISIGKDNDVVANVSADLYKN